MLWKLVGGVALALLITLSTVIGSDLLNKKDEWDRIASPYSFNILRWEFENLFNKWKYRAEQVFQPGELSEAERIQLVKSYLSLTQESNSLQARINRGKAEGLGSAKDIAVWEAQLAALKMERDRIESHVEEIVEGQISGALADEGLSMTLKLGGEAELLFPPLDFEFE